MKKNKIAGIAIGILFMPAFVFLFLYLFGDNHFEVPEVKDEKGQIINIKQNVASANKDFLLAYSVTGCEDNKLDKYQEFVEENASLFEIKQFEVDLESSTIESLINSQEDFKTSCVPILLCNNKLDVIGVYNIADREEFYRFKTEIDIILNQ